MAKTRQQRKAEQRARQQREQESRRRADSTAAHDTQVPISGAVAEAELIEATGLTEEELKAPAPSRADLPGPAFPAEAVEEAPEPVAEPEPRRLGRKPKPEAKPPPPARRPPAAAGGRRRGAVTAFFASCWAELKRVQWPDRNAVGQATAVTLVFVMAAAAYLGALDAVFNWLVKRIL